MTPDQLRQKAKEKRDQSRKLLDEAAALDAKATDIERLLKEASSVL